VRFGFSQTSHSIFTHEVRCGYPFSPVFLFFFCFAFFFSCLVVGIKRAYVVCLRKQTSHSADNPLYPRNKEKKKMKLTNPSKYTF
jgi:hypothetical protein